MGAVAVGTVNLAVAAVALVKATEGPETWVQEYVRSVAANEAALLALPAKVATLVGRTFKSGQAFATGVGTVDSGVPADGGAALVGVVASLLAGVDEDDVVGVITSQALGAAGALVSGQGLIGPQTFPFASGPRPFVNQVICVKSSLAG